jgi:hypothetical protein
MNETVSFTSVLILNLAVSLEFILVFYLLHSRRRLKSQGFNEEYIKFIRKMEGRATLISWFSLLILQVVSFLIVSLFIEKITFKLYIKAIFLLAISLTVIIRFFLDKYIYKRQKELAIRTGSEIVVDFNYKILHKIFRPLLEIIATVIVLAFTLTSLRNLPHGDDNFIIYFYLVFIWYFYISLKSAKNMIIPQFESVYRLKARFMFLFNAILILLVFSNSMEAVEAGKFALMDYIFLTVVIALLVAKLAVYIKGYRSLKKSLPERNTGL